MFASDTRPKSPRGEQGGVMAWNDVCRALRADEHAAGHDPAEVIAGEPGLDELLDDPIMALLWQGDRLDPGTARATVMALRELLRRRHGHGSACVAAL